MSERKRGLGKIERRILIESKIHIVWQQSPQALNIYVQQTFESEYSLFYERCTVICNLTLKHDLRFLQPIRLPSAWIYPSIYNLIYNLNLYHWSCVRWKNIKCLSLCYCNQMWLWSTQGIFQMTRCCVNYCIWAWILKPVFFLCAFVFSLRVHSKRVKQGQRWEEMNQGGWERMYWNILQQ